MTTPTFATAKEAHQARWHSRRHETAESRHEAFRYCPGGPPQTRRDRQESALHRHEATLLGYETELKHAESQEEIWFYEYKIRTTKRTITAAKKKLSIQEEYAVLA